MTRSESHPRRTRGRGLVLVIAAAAAVAAAVAVPVALAGRDEAGPAPSGRGAPAATSSAPEPTPTEQTPTEQAPTEPTRTVLTADVAEDAQSPQVAYVAGGDIVLPDGSHVPLEKDASAVVPFGQGWLVARQEDGQDVLTVLGADGRPQRSFPGGPSLALSPSGLVATQDPDGQVLVGRPSDGRFTELRTDMSLQDIQVVAVTGSDCSTRDRTCAVYYNEFGDLGGGYRMGPSGPVWQFTRFQSIVSASSAGDVAGELAPDGGHRCIGVFDARERRLWDTCEQVLGRFSPDARYVLGLRPSSRDASTIEGISVLDARSGALVADFPAARGTALRVDDVVWETTTTALATVRTDGAWALLRLAADGGLTRVARLGAGDAPPLRFTVTR